MIYFSPATLHFYSDDFQGDYVAAGTWPDDATPIADDVWQTYIGMPPAGKQRGTVDGQPAWVDAAPLPHAVPPSVSAFQARAVLHGVPSKTNPGRSMLDDVNAAVSAPGVDPVAVIAWEYATVIERNGRFIQDMAPALGLTDSDLDALFTAAAAIQV